MYLVLLPYVALQLYVFTLGMSLFLSQATVFFRDMRYIYAVFLTAWMYATPIFYPVSILPPKIQWVVKTSKSVVLLYRTIPVHCVERAMPSFQLFYRGCIISLLVFAIGAWFFRKNQNKFILYI